MILFGPFLQQSVTFPPRETIVDAQGGSLNVTVSYDAGHYIRKLNTGVSAELRSLRLFLADLAQSR